MDIPLGICFKCVNDVYRANSSSLLEKQTSAIENFGPIGNINESGDCSCKFCTVVRLRKPPKHRGLKKSFGGRKRKLTSDSGDNPPQNISRNRHSSFVCGQCFDPDCNGTDCADLNVQQRAKNFKSKNETFSRAVTSSVIKEMKPSPRGTRRLDQGMGGQKLSITLGKRKHTPKITWTAQEILNVAHNFKKGDSNRATVKFVQELTAKHGKFTAERGYQKKIRKLENIFDEDYVVSQVEWEWPGGQIKKAPIVHVKDYEKLVDKINIGRDTVECNTINRFNMDRGDDFFKATLSIVDLTEEETASPKTSGSNMIIPLAVVKGIPENYANVSKVVKFLKINKHENIYWANDVKMFRICNGQQGNSSKFPCGYCIS